jgi:hypothetical protein
MPSIQITASSRANSNGGGTASSSTCAGSKTNSRNLINRPPVLDEQEREHLMRLGADMQIAWSHPAATTVTRKRIVRAVLHEIIARVEGGFVEMVLHWQGGDHTNLKIKKNAPGKHRWTVEEDVLFGNWRD